MQHCCYYSTCGISDGTYAVAQLSIPTSPLVVPQCSPRLHHLERQLPHAISSSGLDVYNQICKHPCCNQTSTNACMAPQRLRVRVAHRAASIKPVKLGESTAKGAAPDGSAGHCQQGSLGRLRKRKRSTRQVFKGAHSAATACHRRLALHCAVSNGDASVSIRPRGDGRAAVWVGKAKLHPHRTRPFFVRARCTRLVIHIRHLFSLPSALFRFASQNCHI